MQQGVRGGVLIVDEAGLVGMRDMNAIFRVAKEQNARVLLQGDERQHAAVPRGTPFKLLQTHAGIKAASVSDIQRQKGQYKAAVECLARGEVEEGFMRLDRIGAIQEVSNKDRHVRLAEDYLAAVNSGKSCLVVSPTHAEGRLVTAAIRERLKEEGKLATKERVVSQLSSFQMTEAMRSDAVNIAAGDVVVFHQNVRGGFRKGDRYEVRGKDEEGRVLVGQGKGKSIVLPLNESRHFDVCEAKELRLAVGDRIRVTQNGMAAAKKQRLINGTLATVSGFNHRGDIVLDSGQVIAKEFGHLAHGYCTTSHASQGKTVDRVLVAIGQESFPAASQEQFYVSASRGRESCTVFCEDRKELLEAVSRSGDRMSAMELARGGEEQKAGGRSRLMRNGQAKRRLEWMERRKRDAAERIPDSQQMGERLNENKR
jgi:ATP-dependent exoDNAse (exonuclease V) alpha subunit